MRVRRRRARPISAQLDSFHEAQAFLKANVGAPCTRADTEGVKAKDGEEAGTREIKVVAIGIYTHMDKTGRPILSRRDAWHFASDCSGDGLEPIVNMLKLQNCSLKRFNLPHTVCPHPIPPKIFPH